MRAMCSSAGSRHAESLDSTPKRHPTPLVAHLPRLVSETSPRFARSDRSGLAVAATGRDVRPRSPPGPLHPTMIVVSCVLHIASANLVNTPARESTSARSIHVSSALPNESRGPRRYSERRSPRDKGELLPTGPAAAPSDRRSQPVQDPLTRGSSRATRQRSR